MANKTRDEYNKKNTIADKNDQNVGCDDDDQVEATESQCGDSVNVLQNNVTLSFENVEGMIGEEKVMNKNTIEIAEHNLGEKVNAFKKGDRNLPKDRTMKVNAILKEIKSDNITEINRLIKACVIFVASNQRKVGFKKKPKKRKCREPWWKRRIKQSIQEIQKYINMLDEKKCLRN